MIFTSPSPFTVKATDLPDKPSPSFTAAQIKQYIQGPSDQLLAALTALVSELNTAKWIDNSFLADLSVKRNNIYPGAVGTAELDPALFTQPTSVEGVQAALLDLQNKVNGIVNAKTFGATGTGIFDDTADLQSGIDYLHNNGGGVLLVPPGTYRASTLNLYDDVIIQGFGDATVFTKTGGNLFDGEGTFGTEIPFAANKTIGDTSISTTIAHGLNVGDLVLIKSQRDALTSDATENWRLGYPTPNQQGCYFGEFGRVKSVDSVTSFTLTSGLIFPSYNMDKTQETATTARASATVQKFTPISNVILRDFKVIGSPARAISFNGGYRCFVENVTYETSADSCFIVFEQSYACKAYKSRVYYDASTTPAAIYSRNAFKLISSYLCGFEDCFGENGTQTFDFTYDAGSIPTTHCFVRNCETKGAINNALTTHGGTYGSAIEDNMFIDNLSNGVSNRSRSAVIKGNRIAGVATGTSSSSYGVSLYEAWARDCTVTGNSLTGFSNAFEITDGTDTEAQWKWVGCVISSNTITNCIRGLYTKRQATNVYSGNSGISFVNNEFKNVIGPYAKLAHLAPYVANVRITGNMLDGSNGANGGIYGEANTTDIYVDGNTLINSGTAFWFLQPTDTTLFPSPSTNLIYIGDGNDVKGGTLFNFEANVGLVGTPNHFGSFHPYADGIGSLGWSQRRWSGVYAVSGVITTSDANLKTDIQPETLGLDFVNQLLPKTYKFTEGESNRTHHGLIAQDLETVIDSLGISLDDFAVITKSQEVDDSGNPIAGQFVYGLRYTELIGILIKAIQELNAKITP